MSLDPALDQRSHQRTDTSVGPLLDYLLTYPIERIEPPLIDPNTYPRAIEAMADAAAHLPGVVAVYGDSGTPVTPSISDVDVAIIVEDDIAHLEALESNVEAVLRSFPHAFRHGPVLVPQSVFGRLPLMANMAMNLDHLAGERLPIIDIPSRGVELEYLDRFVFEPYEYLERQLVPSVAVNNGRFGSFLAQVDRIAGPIGAIVLDQHPRSNRRLVCDIRTGLSKMMKLKYDLERLQRITGDTNDRGVADVIDRIDHLRDTYTTDTPTIEAYLSLVLDTMVALRSLQREFVECQSIYDVDPTHQLLRRTCPGIVTPEWSRVTLLAQMELFDRSGIRGHMLPPVAAAHLATFPDHERLFVGTPPEVRFSDDEAESLIDRRSGVLRDYAAFLERVDPDPTTFSLVTTAFLLDHATADPPAASPSVTRIKARVRDTRNRLIARSWLREVANR